MRLDTEKLREDRPSKSSLIFYIPKSLLDVKKTIEEKSVQEKALIEKAEVVPFAELKIKNAAEVYKITKSYIADLEKGKKSFGIISVGTKNNDLYLLGLASSLSYSRNNSAVLVIVNDLDSDTWKNYNKKFQKGSLSNWKTEEWGPLCLIDHKELLSTFQGNQIDLKLIYSEFDAIFWSMPDQDSVQIFKEAYLDILRSLDSISLVVKPGQVNLKDIKKVEGHFKSLGIPLKGILQEGGKS